MTYEPNHYNAIFRAMRERCGEDWYLSIRPTQWNIWRRQIKERLFDQNFLIADVIASLDEALGKKKWPSRTAFIHRIEDICWLHRRYATPVVKIDTGMQGISSLLRRRHGTSGSVHRM